MPALDGSALEFCRQICAKPAMEEQRAVGRADHGSRARFAIGNGDELIRIEPADHLIVDYTLDYPRPIGARTCISRCTSPDAYCDEVAPARTFGFVREFHKLAEMGLASGGRLDNLILIDDEKVVNTTLRFPTSSRATRCST